MQGQPVTVLYVMFLALVFLVILYAINILDHKKNAL